MLDLHAFRRRHPTSTGLTGMLFRPNTLAHCLDTLSNYGSDREPCTAKAFSLRLGVLSGFVFQRRSPGDTTLSERGQTTSVLQGWHRFTTNWTTKPMNSLCCVVSSPRISIGPAGCRINRDYRMRGESWLPRRVTPVGGPGTRDKTRQAPRHTWQDGHAKNKVGGDGGRTGAGAVEREGEVGNGMGLFAWCL
jgi:hypothetical protein